MRRVEQCVIRPNHCAAIPHLGSAHAKGYFDTGTDLQGFDNRIYLSVEFCEQRAVDLGWTSPEDARALNERVAELERENTRLAGEVDELNRDFEAIDVLASKGFQARKKPGRPPARQKEAV